VADEEHLSRSSGFPNVHRSGICRNPPNIFGKVWHTPLRVWQVETTYAAPRFLLFWSDFVCAMGSGGGRSPPYIGVPHIWHFRDFGFRFFPFWRFGVPSVTIAPKTQLQTAANARKRFAGFSAARGFSVVSSAFRSARHRRVSFVEIIV
jgi:hypothetical protein